MLTRPLARSSEAALGVPEMVRLMRERNLPEPELDVSGAPAPPCG